ncbi:MAG: type IV secretory system conjugative DNA transfer family protein [Gemmatimonadetes bacterium]|nr:type IV secretory system conjugative DNA transfer family protein [Gemmatimonadota bacterium]
MTVRKARRMYSGNRLAPWLSHVMESEEESQRPLLTPDEALRLPDDSALVFLAGERPIWSKKARFYEDRRLLERSRVDPPECRAIEHEWNEWTEAPDPLEASAPEPSAALETEGEDGLDELLDEGGGNDSTAQELAALV